MADIQSIPFANAPQHTGAINDNFVIGIQIGRLTDSAGLDQMKYITIGQLKNAITRTLSALFTFRGVRSEAVPENLAVNDYFYCNDEFTDEEQDIDDGTGTYSHTFYENRIYAYDGTSWADITPILSQGMPVGGTTGQILKKVSNEDFDAGWANEQDISGKADKSEMSVTTNGDKTTIQLKTGTSAEVINQHQDISGKADKAVPSAANNIALLSLIGNLVDSGISKDSLQRVLSLIPAQADPQTNQLADKEFVNSSVATNTATFRGSYNLVSDLSLSTSATEAQIATAIATYLSGHSITADNNDYVFIQIPTSDSTPTEIREIDRYKFNGTAWSLEYPLNNSGFTAAQWAAINSNITAAKVTSYDSHLANGDVHVTAAQKTGWTNAIAGIQGTADAYDPDNESYAVGDPCIYNNVVYLAKEAITAPAGAFDSTKWQQSDLKTLMDGVNTNASAISDISNYSRRERKNITNNLANLSTAIAEQNLEKYGYTIGDYFVGASGYVYHLADMDCNYGGYNSYAVVNTHHCGVVVDTKATSKWADSVTNYSNSILHSYLSGTVLNNIKSDFNALFGGWSNHLIARTELDNSVGGWGTTWTGLANCLICAMTEVQVYGSRVFGRDGFQTGTGSKPLELFMKYRFNEIYGNTWIWLKSLSSASSACIAYIYGYADNNGVSNSCGVSGLILFK